MVVFSENPINTSHFKLTKWCFKGEQNSLILFVLCANWIKLHILLSYSLVPLLLLKQVVRICFLIIGCESNLSILCPHPFVHTGKDRLISLVISKSYMAFSLLLESHLKTVCISSTIHVVLSTLQIIYLVIIFTKFENDFRLQIMSVIAAFLWICRKKECILYEKRFTWKMHFVK